MNNGVMKLPVSGKPSSKSNKYFLFFLWMSVIFISSLVLYSGGFLLQRKVVDKTANCSSLTGQHCHSYPPEFKKAVVIIVDALKYEFATFDSNLTTPSHYQNKLPILQTLVEAGHGKLFEFLADPPTTTMQRIKGLTTGSLPTFIDISNNFGSSEITEDNVIDQLVHSNKTVFFMGDDTWMGLFPKRFAKEYPFPSFDVWDLDTVDKGVSNELGELIKTENRGHWDVLVAHYLGVDHAGHKYGPHHPEMARKLNEMNSVIEKVAQNIDSDTVLIIMGDHGMTKTGDHGGDSEDELSASLFFFSPKFKFNSNDHEKVTVDQVDLVPTLALLLGFPIPFSSLGTFVENVFPLIDVSANALPREMMKKLNYLQVNTQQVMTYLDFYQLMDRNLPQSRFQSLRSEHEQFLNDVKGPVSPQEINDLLERGRRIIGDAKSICRSVWVEFDLNAIVLGIAIFFLQITLAFIVALVPRNRLLERILNGDFLILLIITFIAGLGIGCLMLTLEILPSSWRKSEYIVGLAAAFSMMTFGYCLLWKIRSSLTTMFSPLKMQLKSLTCLGMVAILYLSLFSNSYVVEEAVIFNFCLATVLVLFLFSFQNSYQKETSLKVPICAILLALMTIRVGNVFFRCREEQMGYCMPREFHKPIGTIPNDISYKFYKNWRFLSSVLSVLFVVLVPHLWLKQSGNLNGISLTVCVASYIPSFIGVCVVSFWALQGHEFGSKMVPWQQNVLAQMAFALGILALLVCIYHPKLLYLVHSKGKGVGSLPEGMQDYYRFIRSNWKHFTSSAGDNKKLVFGLGTAISAPILVLLVILLLISMLILGDGQCPTQLLSLISMALYLFLHSYERLSQDQITPSGLFVVPWETVMGWWLLEVYFFYATGHQPTFPSIQWGAAFVGFSGSNYGSDSSVLGFLLPACLIGWNTFVSRIIFAIALPLLFLSPFTLWLRNPSIRNLVKSEPTQNNQELLAVKSIAWTDLDQGEVIILENPQETKNHIFHLYCKYLLLQSLRVFGTMVASAVLRRHLMVWKIFAPRFIFEAVGFMVSVVVMLFSYAIISRVINVMSGYYRSLEKEK